MEKSLRYLSGIMTVTCIVGLIVGTLVTSYLLIKYDFNTKDYADLVIQDQVDEIKEQLTAAVEETEEKIIDDISAGILKKADVTDQYVVEALWNSEKFQSINVGKTGHFYATNSIAEIIFRNKNFVAQREGRVDLQEIALRQQDGRNLQRFVDCVVLETEPFKKAPIRYRDNTQSGSWQWRIFSKIDLHHLTAVIIINEDEIFLDWERLLFVTFGLITSLVITLLSLFYLLLHPFSHHVHRITGIKTSKNVWLYTSIASTILFIALWQTLVSFNSVFYIVNLETSKAKNPEIVEYPGALSYLKDNLNIDYERLACPDSILRNVNADSESIDSGSRKVLSALNAAEENIHQLTCRINSLHIEEEDYVRVAGTIRVKHANRDSSSMSDLKQKMFYFPDAVEEESSLLAINKKVTPKKTDETVMTKQWVTDWKFSAKLYQNLNYRDYPFDVKAFNIRIRHVNSDMEFFIPDFDNIYVHINSYIESNSKADSTNHGENLTPSSSDDSFSKMHYCMQEEEPLETKKTASLDQNTMLHIRQGLDQNLEMAQWDIIDASYKLKASDQLSIVSNSDNGSFSPDYILVVNVKRKLLGPLISNYLLLGTICIILFVLVLLSHASDPGSLITTYVGLFFSLLISHFKLREDLQLHTIVYVEFYYFLLYFLLMVFIIHKYLLHINYDIELIEYKESLLVKVGYWPLILGFLLFFSMAFFSINFIEAFN